VAERIDRRTLLTRGVAAGAGVLAAGLGLEACSSGSSGATATAGRNGVSTAPPRRGGRLVFAVEAEESSLDPSVGRFDATGVTYARTVYDALTVIAADGSVKPYLAESVTPNADHTVWTITARPGVRFHDGTPCDANAIATSMNYFKDGELGVVTTGPIQSIVATDASTVTVTLKQPWVVFDKYLAGGIGGQIGYIVAPAMIANAKASGGKGITKPIGTGPFVYQDWTPGEHFVVTRNANYWRPGLPYLDAIEFRPIPDPFQRANSLQAGTIDIFHTDVADTELAFMHNSSYGYVDDQGAVVGLPDTDFLMFNLQADPVSDIRVRKAVAMAIDLQRYKQVINKGLNPIATQPFVPGTPYYAPSGYPSYDPAQARVLVQEYTHDKGRPPAFTLGSTNSSEAVKAAQVLQQMLTAVGLEVTLQQFQQSDFINNALSGDFQCYEWRQFGAVDPDLDYLFWSPTTIFPPPINLAVNFARNTDPQVEPLLQQGRQNADPAVRARAYQQLAQRFAADLPYAFYDRAIWAVIARPQVQNFNNPTAPDGSKAFGMMVGTVWNTETWLEH